MKIIRPVTITDSILTSTNVHETPPAAYAGGTTYADGDFASTGTAGGVITVWESLQGSNTGNDPASSPLWWVEISTTYAVYDAGTTYAENDIILVVATHKAYKSLQSANTGNYPPDNLTGETPHWIEWGATNPWSAFDQKVGSQVERLELVEYVLEPGVIGGVSLFNLVGTTVQIIMNDPVDGEVYNEEVSLISTEEVFDWFSYFFEEIITTPNVVLLDLPPYGGATLTVQINADTGDTSAVGEIVVGRVSDVGITLYGVEVGIQDYSRKTTDDFGNFEVLERAYSKRVDFPVVVENGKINSIVKTLADIRATPIVWAGTEVDRYASAILTYGYYRDFRVIIPHVAFAQCNLQIEGLT